MTTAVIGKAAIAYAAAGRKVLPVWWPTPGGCACPLGAACRHPGKHPLGALVPNGKDDASSDEKVIDEWWGRYPLANIGLRPELGEVVADVDVKHRGATALLALTREHEALPPTWAARTGGGGLHAWFSYGGPTKGAICPGVDLKHHGGYVIVEPSRHESGGTYEWITEHPVAPLPGWIRRLLAPPAPRPIPQGRLEGPSEGAAAGLIRTLAGTAEGGRNAALHWCACRAYERGGDPTLLADLEATAISIGLGQSEITATMRSAARTAQGAACA